MLLSPRSNLPGVDPSFLTKLEGGGTGIGFENAVRLAHALGVGIAALCGEVDSPASEQTARRLVGRLGRLGADAVRFADATLTVYEQRRRRKPRRS